MRTQTDYTQAIGYSPFDYAMMLVKQGFDAATYWAQARDTQPIEYIEAVLFELGQLPTTEQWYTH